MRKIKVLFWEGLSFPTNTMGADLVIHFDPSNESGTVEVRIMNPEICSELENIFYDEMLTAISENEFDTHLSPDAIRENLQQYFDVSSIDSPMTPKFINGGRVTVQDDYPLN